MSSNSKSSRSSPQDVESRRALVKWLTGKYSGTFTHNVNISWILGLNLEDFADESHVVEWRVPPKPPKGWPVWDCKVLEISDDLDFLKQRMKAEEAKQRSRSGNGMVEEDDRSSSPKISSPKMSSPRIPKPVDHSSAEMRKLFECFLKTMGGASTSESQADETMVKVGQALHLSKSAFLEAKVARTPSIMTVDLVRASFSLKRLKRSSYAGQSRTRNGEVVQKPSLKRYRKMKDIQDFVLQRFPYFSQSAFSHAVNSCTGKNVDKRPPKEFVDESASEDDME